MGFPTERRRTRRRALLVVLLTLAGSVQLLSQSAPALDILPNPVGVNDRFTVSFVVDTPSAAEVAVGEWELPEGVRLYAGPYIRGVVESRPDGTSAPAVSVSYILRSSRAGRIRFPSIPYSVAGAPSRTGEALLRVGIYRSGELSLPLEVAWELPEPPYYAGQTIPAVLVLENAEAILLPDRITVPASKGGFFEEAPELGEISRSVYGGTVLYTVPVTGYLFTPTGAGRHFLNRATVAAGGAEGVGEAVALDILPLPEAVESSGAVGRFRLSTELESQEITAGDEGVLRIRVTGRGNLGYLTLPEPDFGGLQVVRDQEIHAYLPSGDGYNGYREILYNLRTDTPGSFRITVPDFPQFDPESGAVARTPGTVLNLTAVPDLSGEEEEIGFNTAAYLYSPAQLEAVRQPEPLYRWPLYLLFLPGPLLYLAGRLYRRATMKAGIGLLVPLLLLLLSAGGGIPREEFEEADRLFRAGQYEEARDLYASLCAANPENGRLFVNYGLALEESGERGKAAAAFLAASRRSVGSETLVPVWDELALRGEYVRQYALPRFLSPTVSFILLLLFYNLFFIAALIRSFFRRSAPLIATLSAAILALAAAGLLLHAQYQRRESMAVVARDIVSRRIPRETAQEWIELPEGLAVKVTQSSGRFRLVETAYGVEGWVDSGELLYEENLLDGEEE